MPSQQKQNKNKLTQDRFMFTALKRQYINTKQNQTQQRSENYKNNIEKIMKITSITNCWLYD